MTEANTEEPREIQKGKHVQRKMLESYGEIPECRAWHRKETQGSLRQDITPKLHLIREECETGREHEFE